IGNGQKRLLIGHFPLHEPKREKASSPLPSPRWKRGRTRRTCPGFMGFKARNYGDSLPLTAIGLLTQKPFAADLPTLLVDWAAILTMCLAYKHGRARRRVMGASRPGCNPAGRDARATRRQGRPRYIAIQDCDVRR